MAKYYPIFLNLEKKRCLVIGGGKVAERKVQNLLRAGARVTVVAPEITEKLSLLAEKGEIEYRPARYQPGTLKDYFLAVAATDDRKENQQLFREAERLGVLFNAVDQPENCNFIFPAVVRRGDLQISISTSGASPALAREIRKFLQELFKDSIASFITGLREFRQKLLERGEDPAQNEEYSQRVNSWKKYLRGEILSEKGRDFEK